MIPLLRFVHGTRPPLPPAINMADTSEMPPDHNRGGEILTICGVLVGLSLAVVLLRIWVRTVIVKQFGFDDWTITAAMVCTYDVHSDDPGVIEMDHRDRDHDLDL